MSDRSHPALTFLLGFALEAVFHLGGTPASLLAANVTLKSGAQYEGNVARISSVGENPLAPTANVERKPVVVIDDEVRFTYLPFHQSVGFVETPPRNLERIRIPQIVAASGRRIGGVGDYLLISPFDDFGRRTYSMRDGSGGRLDVFQGITEITPTYTKIEGLKTSRIRSCGSCGWRRARFQRPPAIDAAANAGGGTALLPPGTYLSGTLFLKSGVHLYLESGSMLLGSKDVADYPENRPAKRSWTDRLVGRSLIAGEKLRNVAIRGHGTIDGQGAGFGVKYLVRPYLIRLVECEDVLVEGVHLRNSAMWLQHYLACVRVMIRA